MPDLDELNDRYLGAVGRVKQPGKGDWGRDYKVTSVKVDEDDGKVKVTLALESIDRMPPTFNPVTGRPIPGKDLPAAVVPNCPVKWFKPGVTPPAAVPDLA